MTDGIAKVTGDAIVTADGVERQIDVLVVATGFHTTDLPIADHDRRPRRPHAWPRPGREPGMEAYKGTTVHGFPNLFFVVGPNTGLGHSSMVFMIESQVAYIRDAISTDARPTATPRSSRGSRPRQAWNATSSAGWSAPCGAPAAAPAGTSTSTAATSPCGRAPRSRSAAAGRFDAAAYDVTAAPRHEEVPA